MDNINYQKQLDELLDEIQASGKTPHLLLHSCCAPCSSYVLEYLSKYFKITVFYYNPNIEPEKEYKKRALEQKRLVHQMTLKNPVEFIEGEYKPADFYNSVKGLEHIPEGGERCFACYRLRLEKTAELASQLGADYFTTTLSISPLKNADVINKIAAELSEKYHVKNLPSDFKKKEGYKRSIVLSVIFSLYRQDYCGCIFSRNEREENKKANL